MPGFCVEGALWGTALGISLMANDKREGCSDAKRESRCVAKLPSPENTEFLWGNHRVLILSRPSINSDGVLWRRANLRLSPGVRYNATSMRSAEVRRAPATGIRNASTTHIPLFFWWAQRKTKNQPSFFRLRVRAQFGTEDTALDQPAPNRNYDVTYRDSTVGLSPFRARITRPFRPVNGCRKA